MRVFTATLATETNTFAPMPTGLASYQARGYFPAGQHPDQLTFFAAPLWALRERAPALGWHVIEGMVAMAQPSGTTTRVAYETLRDELLADLRAAMPVDMVLLGLHGAMVADGTDDCEGDLLQRVRAIVGPGVVVGAELDPHHHLTDAKVRHADLLIAFKEYPHTDILARAHELVDLCAAIAAGKIKPVAAVVDCEMIAMVHTTRQPARDFVDKIQSLEGKNGILSISIAHGFPWGDVPDMGTKVLVYADGDAAKAQRLARQLADELIGMRDALDAPSPGIDEALDEALAVPAGPVVIADGADNPGGGAPGDSTFILRRIVERGITDAALGPLWDPVAVRIAFEAGVGATLPMRIGGKIGPLSGEPMDLLCTVKALKREMQMTGLGGAMQPLGDCALVEAVGAGPLPSRLSAPSGVRPDARQHPRAGERLPNRPGMQARSWNSERSELGGTISKGVQIVLITVRSQAMDTDLFTQLGCDPATKRIVVVKSSQHFYASYAKIARHVIYAKSPGVVTSDLRSLPYRKIRRPKWPL